MAKNKIKQNKTAKLSSGFAEIARKALLTVWNAASLTPCIEHATKAGEILKRQYPRNLIKSQYVEDFSEFVPALDKPSRHAWREGSRPGGKTKFLKVSALVH